MFKNQKENWLGLWKIMNWQKNGQNLKNTHTWNWKHFGIIVKTGMILFTPSKMLIISLKYWGGGIQLFPVCENIIGWLYSIIFFLISLSLSLSLLKILIKYEWHLIKILLSFLIILWYIGEKSNFDNIVFHP